MEASPDQARITIHSPNFKRIVTEETKKQYKVNDFSYDVED